MPMMFKWYKQETQLGGRFNIYLVPPRGEFRREVLSRVPVQPLESMISSLTAYSVSRGSGGNGIQYLLTN